MPGPSGHFHAPSQQRAFLAKLARTEELILEEVDDALEELLERLDVRLEVLDADVVDDNEATLLRDMELILETEEDDEDLADELDRATELAAELDTELERAGALLDRDTELELELERAE